MPTRSVTFDYQVEPPARLVSELVCRWLRTPSAVVLAVPAVHRQACVLWSSGTPILMVDGRRFKRSNLLRSDDTEARREARRCFGRSDRSAQLLQVRSGRFTP